MCSSAAKPEPRSEPGGPDWAAVGIGIMTIATIVAVATAAAAIALVREYANGATLPIATAAGGFAAMSLIAYSVVILIGLATLFQESPSEREKWTRRLAVMLGIQVMAVVIFAFIAIFGPLLAGILPVPPGDAPADCAASSPPPPVC